MRANRAFCAHGLFTSGSGQGKRLLPEAAISLYPHPLPVLPSGFLVCRASSSQHACRARFLEVDMPRTGTALGLGLRPSYLATKLPRNAACQSRTPGQTSRIHAPALVTPVAPGWWRIQVSVQPVMVPHLQWLVLKCIETAFATR